LTRSNLTNDTVPGRLRTAMFLRSASLMSRFSFKMTCFVQTRNVILISILGTCISFWACGGSSSSALRNGSSPTPGPSPQDSSCPSGREDVMQYFAMSKQNREMEFMSGEPNSLYTEVFPDQDFAATGYWFWLKSAGAHGFDVKSFDQNYVYTRSTELTWAD